MAYSLWVWSYKFYVYFGYSMIIGICRLYRLLQ